MLPLPPLRLSTITVVCNARPSGSASMRAAMSVVPPAAAGTTRVMGRPAHCARAGNAQAAAPAPAAAMKVLRDIRFMKRLLCNELLAGHGGMQVADAPGLRELARHRVPDEIRQAARDREQALDVDPGVEAH